MARTYAAISVALVVLASGAAGPVGVARADDGGCGDAGAPCVILTTTGALAKTHTFSLTELQIDSDQTAPVDYDICCPTTSATTASPSVSIRQLITKLPDNVDPDVVTEAEITNPSNGHQATLLGATHDLASYDADNYPFREELPVGGHLLYPVVWVFNDVVCYVRPLRDATHDNNFNDDFCTTTGSLTVTVEVPDTVVHPTIIGPKTLKVGQSGQFTASVPSGELSGSPSYRWGIGTPASARTMRVAFDKPGSYDVDVTVTGTDPSGRRAQGQVEKRVDVGPSSTPTPGQSSRSGHGSGRTQNPVVGPNVGTGIHAGATAADPSSGSIGPSGGAAENVPAAASSTTGCRTTTDPRGCTTSAAMGDEQGFVPIDGILLEQPAASAQQRSGRPETAPSARRGTIGSATPLFGIGLGAAVLMLLIIGVLGETRRPTRASGKRR